MEDNVQQDWMEIIIVNVYLDLLESIVQMVDFIIFLFFLFDYFFFQIKIFNTKIKMKKKHCLNPLLHFIPSQQQPNYLMKLEMDEIWPHSKLNQWIIQELMIQQIKHLFSLEMMLLLQLLHHHLLLEIVFQFLFFSQFQNFIWLQV